MGWKEVINKFLGKQVEPPKPVSIKDLNAYATNPPPPKPSPRSEAIPTIDVNEEFQRAFDLIENGAPLLFITGKAGTGKSTFIDYLRRTARKRLAVVAPTGLAALNVKGQTIHSFFRFPPGLIDLTNIKRIFDNRLFEQLEVLIVDEVSMVRADVVDGIDRFLRINTGKKKLPFGGVQIVLVGDLFQLPPVANKDEQAILDRIYKNHFFFSAHSLQGQSLVPVEMKKVYRQEQDHFMQILNAIREGSNSDMAVKEINRFCLRKKTGASSQLILTPMNDSADSINIKRLSELEGEAREFRGLFEGKFSQKDESLPAPYRLYLKPGAQVMFVKNDTRRRWVNGTIGTVSARTENSIKVMLNETEQIHYVQREQWETLNYRYDKENNRIISEVVGRYTQYPLKLAWAVTIHKSQGQTMDNILLDLRREIFASGQLYVALSRCRKLEGIRLTRPIRITDVKVDERIKRFYDGMRQSV